MRLKGLAADQILVKVLEKWSKQWKGFTAENIQVTKAHKYQGGGRPKTHRT